MPLRVLMVQSDAQSSHLLARFFNDRGDELWETTDLEQAAILLEKNLPNLLMLDLHYPGNDWLVFLRNAHQKFPDVKIILTNKYPDLQREILAAENGVSIFLRQPFTRPWIENALQRAFSKPNGKGAAPVRQPLPKVKMPVRFKITLPYLVLALMFALTSAYIVSQIVLESIQERYLNQLIETGRQTSDWMVREENRLLSTLRLVSNSQGLAEAIRDRNAEAVRILSLPLAVNAHEEDVAVLDTQAVSLVTMRLKSGAGVGDYEFSKGETVFQQQSFVLQTLLEVPDETGDKYAGLVNVPTGQTFYVSGPVYSGEGKVVGVVLVGKTLRTIVRESSQETLSEVSLYDQNGRPLASTLFENEQPQAVDPGRAQGVLLTQDQSSLTRNLSITNIQYTEIIGPWEARNGDDLGIKGTSLAKTFIMKTSSVTQLQVFVLVALAVLLVVGIGLFLASRITRPLVKLANASTEVAQGNLEVKVDSRGNDEVAVLAHAFNYMIAGLQEGSVYRDLLGRTVSPEVRDQLRQTFTSGNLRLEGQQAVATVLMTDIRGFTSLTERADPAAVLSWLNEYFGRVVPIVTTHGGVVNKFDGDAMLAFFGILPSRQTPKQGAVSACRAALEILKSVNELNTERAVRNEPPLITGIGINTGAVIAGGLGSNDRLHYTIIGDAVNTTQRLEALTRQLYSHSGILVGQATVMALGDLTHEFNLAQAGSFAVKGKAEQLQVFRMESISKPVLEVML